MNESEPINSKKGFYRKLPKGIWVLGLVSMFMDISSELIHSLLPIFMVTTLGASMATIGLVEGFAEATAVFTKVFSGFISDYFQQRKVLAVVGYGLSAITKPIFPLATSIGWVFGARLVDRIGKGIRGAPRDALVAEIAPKELRGAAYGLRQALDSVGAFVGPLLAVALMIRLKDDIKVTLWVASLPALVAVFLLIAGVREPQSLGGFNAQKKFLSLYHVQRLRLRYWLVVALGTVFSLARFSEAFLILRVQDVGLTIAYVPLILIVMNLIYSIFAYPAGVVADRLSAHTILVGGLGILVVADALLAIATSPQIALLGSGFWGLHMALTQGLLSKLVADTAPADLRGTAFGIFNLVSGGALLLASIIAGYLWSMFGASVTFIAGASFAAISIIGLCLYRLNVQPTAQDR